MKKESIKKVAANKKVVLGVLALLTAVVVIAISSFIPFIIDPSKWQTVEFLTDELIICAIVIFSMVATLFIGQASNAQNEASRIAKSRVKFFEVLEKIVNINKFRQWIKKVLQPNDLQEIKIRVMKSVGIEDYSVYNLEFAEIKALLETPQKYNGKFYKGLSKEQVNAILDLKKGKYKVKLVEPEYYLSVSGLVDTRTITERSASEGKKKSSYLATSIIARLTVTIITAMIFASLGRDLMSGVDTGEAFMTFASRMWALVSSAFMGYIVGTKINDIDAEYVEMRWVVLNMFLQDKDFKELTQQEEAKQEFIARVKKETVIECKDIPDSELNLPTIQ